MVNYSYSFYFIFILFYYFILFYFYFIILFFYRLLDAGFDVNYASTYDGSTALMLAANGGFVSVVKELLLRGADKNIFDLKRGERWREGK
jgi:Ankyrin repeat